MERLTYKRQPDEIIAFHVGYRWRYLNLSWGNPQDTVMFARQQLRDESQADWVVFLKGKVEEHLYKKPLFATSYELQFIDDISDPENIRVLFP